ncbi:MAG: FAD-binding oxidoreductase, partial [bacterium]|nr:FAD-binding oxidoreductase [bacterium]
MLLSYKTHLSNKLQLSVDTILFTFTLDDPKEFSFIPGQYMIMIVPQENGEVVRRLYSIASSTAQKNSFELLVHIMTGGKAGMYLSNLKIN